MDLSNKSLALLLVSAIVISLGGTIVSLNRITEIGTTGMVSVRTGYVNATISSNASCAIDKNVMFGTGKPTGTVVLSTDADNSGTTGFCNGALLTDQCSGLPINNTGNVPLNITYNSTKNGSGMLGPGHTVTDFTWVADDLETNSVASCIYKKADWTNVNVSGGANNSVVCSYLNFTDDRDTVVMEFNITIDDNTVPETKTALITVGCVDAGTGL